MVVICKMCMSTLTVSESWRIFVWVRSEDPSLINLFLPSMLVHSSFDAGTGADQTSRCWLILSLQEPELLPRSSPTSTHLPINQPGLSSHWVLSMWRHYLLFLNLWWTRDKVEVLYSDARLYNYVKCKTWKLFCSDIWPQIWIPEREN